MIDYLTHPKFLSYDVTELPSKQGGGGGMGTKTYRVLEALREIYPKTNGISNSDEISADTILIEPLRFTLKTEDLEPVDDLIRALKQHDGCTILYNSELNLMRMKHDLRKKLLSAVDIVTANCGFQREVFRYVNVVPDFTLCDPVPDAFLWDESIEKKPQLVATGNISWQKNGMQVTEVFKRLRGVVERVYIGSASLWFNASALRVPQALQSELYKHVDTVVEEETQEGVSNIFKQSQFGLWVAYHDTFATAVQEMVMAGMLVVGANHGLTKELPIRGESGVEAQVRAITEMVNTPHETMKTLSQANRQWSVENVSYPAFHKQLQAILKAVW